MIIQLAEGTRPRDCLEYLRTLGIVRIVFPAREYGARDWTIVGEEETRRLDWGPARVQQLIDGDGPIPHGLDPESVAAARRIARRLNAPPLRYVHGEGCT